MTTSGWLSNEEVSKYAFKINSIIAGIGHRMLNISMHTNVGSWGIEKSCSALILLSSLEQLEDSQFRMFYDFPAAFVILTKNVSINHQIFRAIPY